MTPEKNNKRQLQRSRTWLRRAKHTALRRKYGVQWWKADPTITLVRNIAGSYRRGGTR